MKVVVVFMPLSAAIKCKSEFFNKLGEDVKYTWNGFTMGKVVDQVCHDFNPATLGNDMARAGNQISTNMNTTGEFFEGMFGSSKTEDSHANSSHRGFMTPETPAPWEPTSDQHDAVMQDTLNSIPDVSAAEEDTDSSHRVFMAPPLPPRNNSNQPPALPSCSPESMERMRMDVH